MKREVLLLTIFIFISLLAFGEYSDFYYQWSSFFFPNIDENAGLTLFPSLFIRFPPSVP